MRIKLVEANTPMIKLERNIYKNIIPAMEEMGFQFDEARELKEKFIYTFFGNYNGANDLSIPFELVLNSTSPKLDDPYQVFATLKMGGDIFDLGSCNTRDAKDFQDLIDTAIPDGRINTKNWNHNAEDKPYESKNGGEFHTRAEWLALKKRNMEMLEPREFGNWWNYVYPDELG